MEEFTQVEHLSEQEPAVRDVGNDDSNRRFADVPIDPFCAIREVK
jgi:hypothetical protein